MMVEFRISTLTRILAAISKDIAILAIPTMVCLTIAIFIVVIAHRPACTIWVKRLMKSILANSNDKLLNFH
jgi:hypothetical protein